MAHFTCEDVEAAYQELSARGDRHHLSSVLDAQFLQNVGSGDNGTSRFGTCRLLGQPVEGMGFLQRCLKPAFGPPTSPSGDGDDAGEHQHAEQR